MSPTTLVRQAIARLNDMRGHSFFMNAFYLMLATFVLAFGGFIFWAIVTRTYDASAVGVATTLISVSGLLSLLGLVGFDTALVRFLPRSPQKNNYISTSIIIVMAASAVISAIMASILPVILPELAVLHQPWAWASFVLFTTVCSVNTALLSIFLAYKSAKYTLAFNSILSGSKIALPLLFAHGNAMAIFILAGGAQLLSLICGLSWLWRTFKFRFVPRVDKSVLQQTKKFSLFMYVSSVLNLVPPTVLPLIIVGSLSSEYAAYYYIAFTIASALYTIAYASMQSVFAEGSHDQSALRSHIIKAAKIVGFVLVPVSLLTALLSYIPLAFFGARYVAHATPLLQLFAFGAVPVALYSGLGAIFKVTKNTTGILAMNITYAATILGLSVLLISQFALVGVGIAWVTGNIAACIAGLFFVHSVKKTDRNITVDT